MVMVLAIQPLMLAGAIRGFAEALVLAEASVEARAEVSGGAVVAAEADLVSGGRFKLALNCRKELILCQEETEQDREARELGPAGVWAGLGAKVAAEWAARSPQDRAEIASVLIAPPRYHMSPGSLVIRKPAQTVVP